MPNRYQQGSIISYAQQQALLEASETAAGQSHYVQAQQQVMQRSLQETAARQHAIAQQLYNNHGPIAPASQARTPESTDFIEILEEFNRAFHYGIREVVVDSYIFYELVAYFNRISRMSMDGLPSSSNHLILNVTGGIIKIINKEYKSESKTIDFDRYMEDVE